MDVNFKPAGCLLEFMGGPFAVGFASAYLRLNSDITEHPNCESHVPKFFVRKFYPAIASRFPLLLLLYSLQHML